MLKIEDKTTEHFGKLVEEALELVSFSVPEKDLGGIEKILLLDECGDVEFNWAGGFYRKSPDGQSAYIELYPSKIINAQPVFLPRIKFFKKYSIIKMFLHELGHHKAGIENLEEREIEAEKYMLSYLKKIYGNRIYLFDFLAKIDRSKNKNSNNSTISQFRGHNT